jgi:hypothetical protein
MFSHSNFNGDISSIEAITQMFAHSDFMGDVFDWNLSSLWSTDMKGVFSGAEMKLPYWAEFECGDEIAEAYSKYHLNKKLMTSLGDVGSIGNRSKI